jgi:glutamine phosphoribosylpyrophosphate amidotransferase
MTYLRHNCGLAVTHSLHDAHSFIKSLQHRGREAAGIAAVGEERIDVLKWVGKVNKFDLTDLHKIFPWQRYHTYLAHVRYATRGRKDKILDDAHPHAIGGYIENRGDHVMILDCKVVGVHNGQIEDEYLSGVDKSKLITGCDTEALLHYYNEKNEKEILRNIPGAYTMAIADVRRKDVIVLRDRLGMMPGMVFEKDGKNGIASENIAAEENGADVVEDLAPGSIYYFDQHGKYRKETIFEIEKLAFCRFQYNYVASKKSTLNGINVRAVRELFGKQCAIEFPFTDIDFVTYAPRCPKDAARVFANELHVEFLDNVFYKTSDERSFQGSTESERTDSIKKNLHLVPYIKKKIRGKKGIVIEDSSVRGNVGKRIKHLLYDVAGVKEASIISYTPKIGIIGEDGTKHGCTNGVDMPPNDDFVVRVKDDSGLRNRTNQEISDFIGMPIMFLSRKGEMEVFKRLGLLEDDLCTRCTGGDHPFVRLGLSSK